MAHPAAPAPAPAAHAPLAGWRPGLSDREAAALVRTRQSVAVTLREVAAIEYADGDGSAYTQLGGLEQLDGTMWLVAGIFEPALPDGPWVVAHVARGSAGPVLRTPPVLVAQPDVTRVHDGIDDA